MVEQQRTPDIANNAADLDDSRARRSLQAAACRALRCRGKADQWSGGDAMRARQR